MQLIPVHTYTHCSLTLALFLSVLVMACFTIIAIIHMPCCVTHHQHPQQKKKKKNATHIGNSPQSCLENIEFACHNRDCIPIESVCDGIPDCGRDEDEDDALCKCTADKVSHPSIHRPSTTSQIDPHILIPIAN